MSNDPQPHPRKPGRPLVPVLNKRKCHAYRQRGWTYERIARKFGVSIRAARYAVVTYAG